MNLSIINPSTTLPTLAFNLAWVRFWRKAGGSSPWTSSWCYQYPQSSCESLSAPWICQKKLLLKMASISIPGSGWQESSPQNSFLFFSFLPSFFFPVFAVLGIIPRTLTLHYWVMSPAQQPRSQNSFLILHLKSCDWGSRCNPVAPCEFLVPSPTMRGKQKTKNKHLIILDP